MGERGSREWGISDFFFSVKLTKNQNLNKNGGGEGGGAQGD